MNSNLSLIYWFWWRNRIQISIIVASVVVAQLIYWTGIVFEHDALNMMPLLLSIGATVISAMAVFTFGSNLDLTSGKSSFPQWLFTLPIASFRLALVPALAMALTLAWGWMPAIAAISTSPASGSEPVSTSLLILPWLGMCAFGNWLQAISWYPFRSAWHRLIVILLMSFLVALLSVLGMIGDFGPQYATTVIVLCALTGFVAAIASATHARRFMWRSDVISGTAFGLSWDSEVEDKNRTLSPLSSFKNLNLYSALAALRWRDWHRLGKAPVLLALLIVVPLVVLVLSVETSPNILAFLLVPAALLSLASSSLAKTTYWKGEFGLSNNLSSLPVSDEKLLLARFRTTLRASVLTWALTLAVVLIWLTKSSSRSQFEWVIEELTVLTGSGLPVMMAIFLFTFYIAVVAPWPGLAIGLFGKRWITWTVFATLFLASMVLSFATGSHIVRMIVNHTSRAGYLQWMFDRLPSFLVSALILKFVFAVSLLAIAIRNQLLNWKTVSKLGALLATGCVVLISLFLALLQNTELPFFEATALLIAMFPCGSLILARIALDSDRHR